MIQLTISLPSFPALKTAYFDNTPEGLRKAVKMVADVNAVGGWVETQLPPYQQ